MSLERDLENLPTVTHRVPRACCAIVDIGSGTQEGKKSDWASAEESKELMVQRVSDGEALKAKAVSSEFF